MKYYGATFKPSPVLGFYNVLGKALYITIYFVCCELIIRFLTITFPLILGVKVHASLSKIIVYHVNV